MTDLRDAVDDLTAPIIEHIVQRDDNDRWLRAHTVVQKPLLQQLADAVKPASTVSGPGTPSMPSERSPIDLNLLLEYAKIASELRSWCHSRQVPVTRPPDVDVCVDLNAWLEAVESEEEFDGFFFLGRLRWWARQIRDLLQPGERFEAPYPCPVCGSLEWGDYIGGGSMRAILVTYRVDDDGHVSDERAVCRGSFPDGSKCGTVWEGHDAVDELGREQTLKNA